MTLQVCRVPGCPMFVKHRGHCEWHARLARKQRGDAGYGWQHQKRRARLKARAVGTPCPDCGVLMTDVAMMVADHTVPLSVDPTSVADRVHCRTCSSRQGGTLGRNDS